MPALPLPFVAALLLAVLCGRLIWTGEDGRRLTPPALFAGACTLALVVVGLRWSVDSDLIRFLQPVAAAALPPLAWICFARLYRPAPAGLRRLWPHLLPVGLALLLSATWGLWHPPIDLMIAALFLAYGIRMVALSAAGPDRLTAARFSETATALRSLRLVGALLIASGLVDLSVGIDFGLWAGRHAETIVAIANLIALPLAACAVTAAGSRPPPSAVAAPPARPGPEREPQDPAEDRDTIAKLDALLRQRELFRDPDLTLERLARRAGLPGRRISGAVNRQYGRNVSQVINEYRVAAARVRLSETDDSVTGIMYDCGFQTKSNFNREFRRVVGTTPTAYRESCRRTGVIPASGARPPAGSP